MTTTDRNHFNLAIAHHYLSLAASYLGEVPSFAPEAIDATHRSIRSIESEIGPGPHEVPLLARDPRADRLSQLHDLLSKAAEEKALTPRETTALRSAIRQGAEGCCEAEADSRAGWGHHTVNPNVPVPDREGCGDPMVVFSGADAAEFGPRHALGEC